MFLACLCLGWRLPRSCKCAKGWTYIAIIFKVKSYIFWDAIILCISKWLVINFLILIWNCLTILSLQCVFISHTVLFFLRHDDVQLLEKMKTMVIFIERTLDNKVIYLFCPSFMKSLFILLPPWFLCKILLMLQGFSFGSLVPYGGGWCGDVKLLLYLICWFLFFILIQEVIQLSFYSQPDGHVTGKGSFQSSILVPGYAY